MKQSKGGSLNISIMDNISEPNSKLSYEELLEQNTKLKNQIKEIHQQLDTNVDELKKNEEKLLKSEQFLNDMGAMSKVGGWQLNLETQELIWTREVYAIHEVDEDFTPTVEKAVNFYYQTSMQIIQDALDEAIKSGNAFDTDLKIKTAKGNIKDVRAIGKVINNKDGIAETVFGTFQDITEKKRNEDEIKRTHYYLRKAQEIGKIGTWELDIINNKLIWTEENYKNFGVKHGIPLNYEIFLNCIHPDDRDYVNNEWSAAINGRPYDIEHRVVVDGKVKWLREKADVKFDENGKAISAIGFSQDITKLKESEQNLKESEKKYKDLFENIIDEVHYWKVIKDKNGEIKTWELADANKSALKAWNKTKEQVVGKTTNEIFNYDAVKIFMPIVKKIFKTGKPYRWEEYFPATKQYLAMDSIPLGEYFISTGRDISIRKKEELELQNAQEQVNSNLQQIKVIQANTPNVIWKWDFDKDGNFTNIYISEAADEFLALPIGSIDNSLDKFFSYILPEYLPLIDDAIKNAIKNPNKLISIEYEVKKADGKLAWFSSSGKVVHENNKLTIYGSTFDITEKKQNEQKLVLSDTVFNFTLDMFCIAGFDGYFKYLNPSWERTLGWSIEELLSKPWLDFVHPDDAENTEDIKSVIVDGKEIYKFENRYVCKDGSIKWLAWNSQPFPKENIMIGAARDITEAKKIENELIKAKEKAEVSEERYRNLVEAASDAIYLTEEDGTIIDTNQSALDFTGKNREEIIGQNIETVDVNFPAKEFVKFWKKYPINKQLIFETTHRHKNGGLIPVEISSKKYKLNDRIYLLGIARDIAERKKSELELIKAKEKAEESDRLKSAFLANMSHEIRTPMNGILGFTSLLQKANLSVENQKHYIDIIEKSGNRLLNTVNDIIEISKIESGDINVAKSEVDIIGHLDTLVTFFKPEAKKKNIEIVVQNTIDGNDLTITTDKNKLSSILSNLIKNAIKYTNEGTIKVGLKMENNHILFSCQDTGIGIPKNRQEAIFNRFEQADIEDKQAHQGSGLGLAIVKTYVEMLNGKIWVESEEGIGSTFYVSLAFEHEKKKKQIIPREVKSSDSGIKNINVLVVEDEEYSSMHLSILMKDKVKSIKTAENGIEAIDACKNDSGIDLILMDIKMPKMGGLEATKNIRKFNTDVVIIAQTAHVLEGDKEKALDAGCNDYISKPIKKDTLFELINKYF